jgi:hypothetical protein
LPRWSSSAEFQPTEELIEKERVVREVVHDDFPGNAGEETASSKRRQWSLLAGDLRALNIEGLQWGR